MKAYLAVFLLLLALFGYQSIQSRKKQIETLRKKIEKGFGKKQERIYKAGEMERIADFYHRTVKKEDGFVDDITWNDLSMDEVYQQLNHTYSYLGEESLYRRLRVPQTTQSDLQQFGNKVSAFEEDASQCKKLQECYAAIGKTGKTSVYPFLEEMEQLQSKSNQKHIVANILLLLCFAGLFVNPVVAVLFLFVVLAFNIYTYYKEKNDVTSYFKCLQYLVQMLEQADGINKELKNMQEHIFDDDVAAVDAILAKTAGMKRGMFLIGSQNVNDSIVEMILSYVRMIFHVDLIKYNQMVKSAVTNREALKKMYLLLGDIEAATAIASFRTYLTTEALGYSTPVFQKEVTICCEEIYHPLIKNAVTNTMTKEKSVLLTGSNASGKSTFLKTVAINAILAQTIDTVTAKHFELPLCDIYSSMALRDDLSGKDSYYMAEIKALKRILDRMQQGRVVLCFIDEVLRGTNTIERIAASAEILLALQDSQVICFAATHDIELTYLLEGVYSNYHFSEEITKEDVTFPYQLEKGRTVTRNAIRLLETLHYPQEITRGAEKRVLSFTESGKWTKSTKNS